MQDVLYDMPWVLQFHDGFVTHPLLMHKGTLSF